MFIELEWKPNTPGKYPGPKSVSWFQTVRTNMPTHGLKGNEPQLKRLRPIEFVDGDQDAKGVQESQEARFFYKTPQTKFDDRPWRWSQRAGPVYWKAETSIVGIKGKTLERLMTYYWGFWQYSNNTGKLIKLRTVRTPTAYHTRKLAELQAKMKPARP